MNLWRSLKSLLFPVVDTVPGEQAVPARGTARPSETAGGSGGGGLHRADSGRRPESEPELPDVDSRGTVYPQQRRPEPVQEADLRERERRELERRERPSPWEPVVLERPVSETAWRTRPPESTTYRPDCVTDGWSTGFFTIRAASVRGYEHRFRGTPRQDDIAVAHHEATGTVVFAVADGVSDAPLSHIGATSVCRSAINGMLAALDGPEVEVDWQGLLQQAAWQLCEQARLSLRLPEVDPRVADEQMATTLVAGLVRPLREGPVVEVVQVGDSSAWILQQGGYQRLLRTKHSGDGAVYSSATDALPRVPQVKASTGVLTPGQVLLAGTDGFGDPLGDGDGVVGDHFARALAEPPPILKFAHDLDFSRETFDDDRTLFVLWPHWPKWR
ncbi:protein phosphatase 2C domain-containing protein [Actinoplanes sp. NPDC024001]|uniref:protein phosphatase 2C domain-containing protein n=1 Tax=Actinoplanes sp. NPDC024001 TaxID=3154598 RepID=UPI0033CB73FD